MRQKPKTILFLSGGAMRGVFGAGVVTRLQQANVYDELEAVYAYSSGAFNAAYFMARQSAMGSTIYFDYLITDFVNKRHLPLGLLQRFWYGHISRRKSGAFKNVLNIQRLMEIAKRQVPLDIEAIKRLPIPLYVKLLNSATGEIEYIDLRTADILQVLHAAVSAAPYYFSFEEINGSIYIDAGIKESIALAKLLEDNKQNNIVVVFNRPPYKRLGGLVKYIETKTLGAMYGKKIEKLYDQRGQLEDEDMRLAESHDRVLLVHPSREVAVFPGETNRKKLLALYNAGQKEAEKVLAFIK